MQHTWVGKWNQWPLISSPVNPWATTVPISREDASWSALRSVDILCVLHASWNRILLPELNTRVSQIHLTISHFGGFLLSLMLIWVPYFSLKRIRSCLIWLPEWVGLYPRVVFGLIMDSACLPPLSWLDKCVFNQPLKMVPLESNYRHLCGFANNRPSVKRIRTSHFCASGSKCVVILRIPKRFS